MPTKPRSLQKRNSSATRPIPERSIPKATPHSPPRCAKCGSRTVRLEQLRQELLVVAAIHCLICGHHTFIGKPVVRLIRRPAIPDPAEFKKTLAETS